MRRNPIYPYYELKMTREAFLEKTQHSSFTCDIPTQYEITTTLEEVDISIKESYDESRSDQDYN